MNFNLSQSEVEHIVGEFIVKAGLNFGGGQPTVSMVINDDDDVEAQVSVAIDIVNGLGGAALTVLGNKPATDLTPFQGIGDEPKPKKTRRKKAAPTVETAPAAIEAVAVAAVVTPVAADVQEINLVEEGEDSPFSEETPPAAVVETSDSLFGSSEADTGSLFSADAVPGVVVEPVAEADSLNSDQLFFS